MSGLASSIERLAYRAWPAAEEDVHDGWTLRRSPGLPARRINSATSPIGAIGDLGRIAHVIEAWYRRRDAVPVVRVLSASAPEIDRHFSAIGWADESPTAVMTKRLSRKDPVSFEVTLSPTATDRWLAAKQRMTAMTGDTIAAWADRASAIRGWTAFAAVEQDDDIIAIGLGVVEDGWLGIFDMQTEPELRRRGRATHVVRTLEAAAAERGAVSAYLQVEMRNVPARALYAREGYGDVYRYWYRRAGT